MGVEGKLLSRVRFVGYGGGLGTYGQRTKHDVSFPIGCALTFSGIFRRVRKRVNHFGAFAVSGDDPRRNERQTKRRSRNTNTGVRIVEHDHGVLKLGPRFTLDIYGSSFPASVRSF
jgi:hypothetical protein